MEYMYPHRTLRPLYHLSDAFLDVHLMVSHPEQWLNDMAEAGANSFIFHIEATNNPKELITKIKELKMKVRLILNVKQTDGTMSLWFF